VSKPGIGTHDVVAASHARRLEVALRECRAALMRVPRMSQGPSYEYVEQTIMDCQEAKAKADAALEVKP
jgi:hypothetical protein